MKNPTAQDIGVVAAAAALVAFSNTDRGKSNQLLNVSNNQHGSLSI
jgi:hypothetical protein